jgi:hypothetical protein
MKQVISLRIVLRNGLLCTWQSHCGQESIFPNTLPLRKGSMFSRGNMARSPAWLEQVTVRLL